MNAIPRMGTIRQVEPELDWAEYVWEWLEDYCAVEVPCDKVKLFTWEDQEFRTHEAVSLEGINLYDPTPRPFDQEEEDGDYY